MRNDKIGQMSSVFIMFSFILTCFSSCENTASYVDIKTVQQLKIAYLPKGINPDMDISYCDAIYEYPEELINYTVVTNPEFISSFIDKVNTLTKSRRAINYDFRINCIIIHQQGEKNEICFGEDHLIVFDGVLMEDNAELFKMINSIIYKK